MKDPVIQNEIRAERGIPPIMHTPPKVRVKAKHRRLIHAAIAGLWLGPGAILSVIYAHSLAWIVFMSWFAAVYAAVSAFAAETPVEPE